MITDPPETRPEPTDPVYAGDALPTDDLESIATRAVEAAKSVIRQHGLDPDRRMPPSFFRFVKDCELLVEPELVDQRLAVATVTVPPFVCERFDSNAPDVEF